MRQLLLRAVILHFLHRLRPLLPVGRRSFQTRIAVICRRCNYVVSVLCSGPPPHWRPPGCCFPQARNKHRQTQSLELCPSAAAGNVCSLMFSKRSDDSVLSWRRRRRRQYLRQLESLLLPTSLPLWFFLLSSLSLMHITAQSVSFHGTALAGYALPGIRPL